IAEDHNSAILAHDDRSLLERMGTMDLELRCFIGELHGKTGDVFRISVRDKISSFVVILK
ncbi:hypothetical protein RCU41_10795, partial [Escherichia marmotae]|nr:hypothetical protein [Escherichia marmotae]